MSDADSYGVFRDARGRIRETAKWIVTILGSVLVLIVGGGLIANIPTLESFRMHVAEGALFTLAFACVVPLILAINILASPFLSFQELVDEKTPEYEDAKKKVDAYLATQPGEAKTIADIAKRRNEINTAPQSDSWWERHKTESEQAQLEERIRGVIELASIRVLETRFRHFRWVMAIVGVVAAVCVGFLFWAFHKEEGAAGPISTTLSSDYFAVFAPGQACRANSETPPLKSGATGETVSIEALASRMREGGNRVLRVIGSADSQVLGEEARKLYGNDVSLALARAHCVAGALQTQLALKGVYVQTTVGVRGPAQRVPADLDRTVEIQPLP